MSGAATPHAPTSARASLPPTGSATPALPPPAPTTPGLPPPSTFDVLPDLHKLLKRLLETSAQPPAATPSSAQPPADGPLDIQHVASAANDIRLKIQKARRAVLALPDIDRTCEDQEDEIEDLEARIARLKASLRELGRPSTEPEEGDGDQSMTG
ncbi:Nn.00g049170.m01.CDS01 [Neocucurbitaria sp. VM-36]